MERRTDGQPYRPCRELLYGHVDLLQFRQWVRLDVWLSQRWVFPQGGRSVLGLCQGPAVYRHGQFHHSDYLRAADHHYGSLRRLRNDAHDHHRRFRLRLVATRAHRLRAGRQRRLCQPDVHRQRLYLRPPVSVLFWSGRRAGGAGRQLPVPHRWPGTLRLPGIAGQHVLTVTDPVQPRQLLRYRHAKRPRSRYSVHPHRGGRDLHRSRIV